MSPRKPKDRLDDVEVEALSPQTLYRLLSPLSVDSTKIGALGGYVMMYQQNLLPMKMKLLFDEIQKRLETQYSIIKFRNVFLMVLLQDEIRRGAGANIVTPGGLGRSGKRQEIHPAPVTVEKAESPGR